MAKRARFWEASSESFRARLGPEIFSDYLSSENSALYVSSKETEPITVQVNPIYGVCEVLRAQFHVIP